MSPKRAGFRGPGERYSGGTIVDTVTLKKDDVESSLGGAGQTMPAVRPIDGSPKKHLGSIRGVAMILYG